MTEIGLFTLLVNVLTCLQHVVSARKTLCWVKKKIILNVQIVKLDLTNMKL